MEVRRDEENGYPVEVREWWGEGVEVRAPVRSCALGWEQGASWVFCPKGF